MDVEVGAIGEFKSGGSAQQTIFACSSPIGLEGCGILWEISYIQNLVDHKSINKMRVGSQREEYQWKENVPVFGNDNEEIWHSTLLVCKLKSFR